MKHTTTFFGIACVAVFALSSCKQDPNSPGVEYMPDMYRSPALEAYVDYGTNKTMDWTQDMKDAAGLVAVQSRVPAANTIPYVKAEMMPYVMPYAMNNTPEDYERAGVDFGG